MMSEKKNKQKKTFQNVYESRMSVFATEMLCHMSNLFYFLFYFFTLAMFCMRNSLKLFNSANKSECIK